MDSPVQSFAADGFVVISKVIGDLACDALVESLCSRAGAGDRQLLAEPACGKLASCLAGHPLIATLLPEDSVAVQCTLFDKSSDNNWLVALHQDLSIPVAERVEDPRCSGWSIKQGVHYVQPAAEVLETLTAVRIHLDDCTTENGPLRVIAASHRSGRLSAEQIAAQKESHTMFECLVSRGGALVMRPLLLHASSKAKARQPRRVLHFLFGPRLLPWGLRWHQVSEHGPGTY